MGVAGQLDLWGLYTARSMHVLDTDVCVCALARTQVNENQVSVATVGRTV